MKLKPENLSLTVYRVEAFENDDWRQAPNAADLVDIPDRLKFRRAARELAPRPLFMAFSSATPIFKQTGLIGTATESKAHEMAKLLRQYNPSITYRVVFDRVTRELRELKSYAGKQEPAGHNNVPA